MHPESLESIDFQQIFDFLSVNRQYIDGVCITGGEPTLQPELAELCKKIKKMRLKVKLDTNGSHPEVLFKLLNRSLVDYVAMDIKSRFVTESYSKASGIVFREEFLAIFLESIDLIMKAAPDYEFRTTVVPTVHTPKDIEQICKYAIKGARRYVIQNFQPCETLIDASFAKLKPFTLAELEQFKEAAQPYVKEVKIRSLNQNI